MVYFSDMNESTEMNLIGDLFRVEARIKLFEAIQGDEPNLLKVEEYYLRNAENVCLENDYTIAAKKAIEKGDEIPSRKEAFKNEVIRRYNMDLEVGRTYKSNDPTILGRIKNLPDLIADEREQKSKIRSMLFKNIR